MAKSGSKSGGNKSGGISINRQQKPSRSPRTNIEKGSVIKGPGGAATEAINVPKPPKNDGNKNKE